MDLLKNILFQYNRCFKWMQVLGAVKMKGIFRYEKVILLITLGCLLLFGSWFLRQKNIVNPYRVIPLQEPKETANIQEYRENDWPDSLLPGEQININTAQEKDLQRLPGVGEKLAKEIVMYREKNGAFQCVDELVYVSGIGETKLKQLRKYTCVIERSF